MLKQIYATASTEHPVFFHLFPLPIHAMFVQLVDREDSPDFEVFKPVEGDCFAKLVPLVNGGMLFVCDNAY